MLVRILGRSNLRPQQSRASLGVMVAVDTIFDEAPCSVDHLRATLDSDLLPTWQGMLLELHKDRVLPRPLGPTLHDVVKPRIDLLIRELLKDDLTLLALLRGVVSSNTVSCPPPIWDNRIEELRGQLLQTERRSSGTKGSAWDR